MPIMTVYLEYNNNTTWRKVMTPAENIYRSDENVVDGLDIVDMMEDDQYESVLYDDDGQPDLEQECNDLYGYGPEWDCYHDTIDYPEDWG
tara:strand:- start:508 stop:777 length:270 start_codon:yes stop_codon:yes gene_type:complete